jgi:hypothetical protein
MMPLRSLTPVLPHLPIMAFAYNNWNGPWMNRQHILSRMAQRGWQVQYSNGRVNHWAGLKKLITNTPFLPTCAQADGVIQDYPSLSQISIPTLPLLDHHTLKWHAQSLKRRAGPSPIAYLFHPDFSNYIDHLDAKYVVLHIYDAYHATPNWRSSKQYLLEQCAERANLVIATSEHMLNTLPGHLASKAHIVNNGADSLAFYNGKLAEEPKDLSPIKGIKIGCSGVFGPKIDFKLLRNLAQRHSDWDIVLIGPFIRGARKPADAFKRHIQEWDELLAQPNIHWLGEKHTRELPAYVARMDVNLMPYKVAQREARWTRFGYPLKLHEYLSAGAPIVSAELPTLRPFSDVLSFAATTDEWSEQISSALKTKNSEMAAQRQELGLKNSWDHRVDQIEKLLLQMINPSA